LFDSSLSFFFFLFFFFLLIGFSSYWASFEDKAYEIMIDRDDRVLLLRLSVLHRVSFLEGLLAYWVLLLILMVAMRYPEKNAKSTAKISIIILLL
jgi:hypothetical protein